MNSSPVPTSPNFLQQLELLKEIVSNLASEMTDQEHINQVVKALEGLVTTPEGSKVEDLQVQIQDLKLKMADKGQVDFAAKDLPSHTSSSGCEWSPSDMDPGSYEVANSLAIQIKICGEKVRDLKLKKADKATIRAAVQELLKLKEKYRTLVGKELTIGTVPRPAKPVIKKMEEKPKKKLEKKSVEENATAGGKKKQTKLCMEADKDRDFPNWYFQVLTKSDMLDYYDVSGCYIIRPWGYAIWQIMVEFLNRELTKIGVENCIFPLLITQQALEKEATHLKDFAPEVAWVTKTGNSTLKVPLAIRPTSETGMYPAYAKWIRSHKDLPLKYNQWNNVLRWEFKDPTPFIRSREFHWQEGHTAFATETEAKEEALYVLNKIYSRLYEEILAVPVIRGRKTEKEKFAGAVLTNTIEAFIPANGRGVQAATSHYLGQNFAKMFNISFQDPVTDETKLVSQNSFGLTTRIIGVGVMVHGDNKGLVLPPNVAPKQVVIVPCGITNDEEEMAALMAACRDYERVLQDAEIRVHGDYRDYYTPGWKFNHWEIKGVPIRLEIGPKDVKKDEYVVFRRDTCEKNSNKPKASVVKDVKELLENIQQSLLQKATAIRDDRLVTVDNFDEFISEFNKKNMILAPFCEGIACEENIKADSRKVEGDKAKDPSMGAKSLCIPFEQAPLEPGTKCIHPLCPSEAKTRCLFGRSY